MRQFESVLSSSHHACAIMRATVCETTAFEQLRCAVVVTTMRGRQESRHMHVQRVRLYRVSDLFRRSSPSLGVGLLSDST